MCVFYIDIIEGKGEKEKGEGGLGRKGSNIIKERY